MLVSNKKINLRNPLSLGSSCIHRIRGKEDLEQLKNQFGHVALLLHSNNCGPCKEDVKDLENECRKFGQNSPIAFARCELNDKGCQELWAESKPNDISAEEYGYPVKLGLNSDSDIKNPIWFVHGRDPDKMNMVFSKIRQATNQSDNIESKNHQYTKQFANPRSSNVQSNPRSKIQSLHSGYNQDDGFLCVNCDKNMREKKMKAFILGL